MSKLITVFFLLLTIFIFEFYEIDIWVQDHMYNRVSNGWFLNRDEEILKLIFYDGIKKVIILCVLLVFFVSLLFRKYQFVKKYKNGIVIFLFSAMLVPLTVGALKEVTNIPCPGNLERYGGDYPYVTLFTPYPESFYQEKNIACYPAGHASGGFALLSLIFLFKERRNKIFSAVFALSLGWMMGGYKMLIGDHFLSHTIITMLLAWLIILIVAESVCVIFERKNNKVQ